MSWRRLVFASALLALVVGLVLSDAEPTGYVCDPAYSGGCPDTEETP